MLTHAHGVRALIDASRLSDHVAQNRRLTFGELLIDGEMGSLRLDGDGGLFFRDFGSNDETRLDYDLPRIGFAGDCVAALQAHVLAHLRDGAPLENRATDYLTNLEVEEAAYRSAERGAQDALGDQGGRGMSARRDDDAGGGLRRECEAHRIGARLSGLKGESSAE